MFAREWVVVHVTICVMMSNRHRWMAACLAISAATTPAGFKGIEDFELETEALHPVLTEARVVGHPPSTQGIRLIAPMLNYLCLIK
eukprot:scaffold136610_cov38-Prasinocladus_malaysianus.AAC.1